MKDLIEAVPDELLAWLERYQCATRQTRNEAVELLLRRALAEWETCHCVDLSLRTAVSKYGVEVV